MKILSIPTYVIGVWQFLLHLLIQFKTGEYKETCSLRIIGYGLLNITGKSTISITGPDSVWGLAAVPSMST